MRRKPQNALVLDVLADGAWHDHHELYALELVAHSRVAELCSPELGYTVERSHRNNEMGERRYLYRLSGVPPVPPPRAERLEAQLEDWARAAVGRMRAEGTHREIFPSHRQGETVLPAGKTACFGGRAGPGRGSRGRPFVERDNMDASGRGAPLLASAREAAEADPGGGATSPVASPPVSPDEAGLLPLLEGELASGQLFDPERLDMLEGERRRLEREAA